MVRSLLLVGNVELSLCRFFAMNYHDNHHCLDGACSNISIQFVPISATIIVHVGFLCKATVLFKVCFFHLNFYLLPIQAKQYILLVTMPISRQAIIWVGVLPVQSMKQVYKKVTSTSFVPTLKLIRRFLFHRLCCAFHQNTRRQRKILL